MPYYNIQQFYTTIHSVMVGNADPQRLWRSRIEILHLKRDRGHFRLSGSLVDVSTRQHRSPPPTYDDFKAATHSPAGAT